ncbi:molybdopterin/thiamine biosynthesis adenylyltransferase [Halohasta litchfieldiae]|jgi:adenylyltransferase/sulfurtransferase|uniref:Molybdopterin or thiamine biosynthesis adenylyltransferase n=1 Tax=Halohasta litchfieldiae TaxID=1073996 RepID=A0A1H6R3W5_9EURY|nr:molybdopterin-synthase adenylyltransferase MoeB [Halohasta litchfieldiae]ATW88449.1 molybdopterin/thiamine biosynthesis adenylyltransferase [Halohasta litchfieldiae]SEI50521.1 Molybdopterin or thiamine biosynthesis adenylyltransferase [Halohasta litchfieldiae]
MSLSLDATQLDRYSRHIIMDEIGPEGQAKLLESRVLVVGAGGLGAPVIQYLAAAGVGTIGIVDDDTVERSNLQRQVIHADGDVGTPKVDSAADFISDLNPDITVETHEVRLSKSNAEGIIAGYDLVVDASDNFPTRYLVNDVCRLAGIPVAHGAIYKFEGQVTSLVPEGPCYRCLFPEAPEPGTVPDCATTGVLGVLPGTVGCLQATEAVKLLLDLGEPLVGTMLCYDAMDLSFERVPYQSRVDCPVCGDDPIESIEGIEYSESCAINTESVDSNMSQ